MKNSKAKSNLLERLNIKKSPEPLNEDVELLLKKYKIDADWLKKMSDKMNTQTESKMIRIKLTNLEKLIELQNDFKKVGVTLSLPYIVNNLLEESLDKLFL